MARLRLLRPATRRRLAWLVAVLLVWQQLAMAAYACTLPPSAIAPAMAVASANAMAMEGTCPTMHDSVPDRTVCQAHCHPDRAAQPDARTGSVPPSALAALPVYWPAPTLALATSGRAPQRLDRLRAPPPPATLLYCSLLI
ncbi:hypothetical protein J7I44_13920 [Frateuria sp. MAH-13]|jgi:hypothetical protein|uniref:Copper resistance protein n=1 Tax=Frateuria flava TaxID=2821489 RepID=A0ABS4DQR5_9GAMM|nr:hypothetical protein [Frateuria flava]MBP1475406.1 hypothetical protein [Frateuria flava]